MKEFTFTDATPLIEFVEKNSHRVVGQTLVSLYTDCWPVKGGYMTSENPIVIELEDYCIVVNYFLISSLTIEIASKEELKAHNYLKSLLQIKDRVNDYYNKEFDRGEDKESIEGCKITKISVERFSEQFEYNLEGDIRPEGGDYFSTIRIYLDGGTIFCICGAPAVLDGWVYIWCE